MTTTRATVTCPDCDLQESFEKLGSARACIETHRRETGHDPVWELGELADGVVRAGDAGGVCGVPGSTDGVADAGADDEQTE